MPVNHPGDSEEQFEQDWSFLDGQDSDDALPALDVQELPEGAIELSLDEETLDDAILFLQWGADHPDEREFLKKLVRTGKLDELIATGKIEFAEPPAPPKNQDRISAFGQALQEVHAECTELGIEKDWVTAYLATVDKLSELPVGQLDADKLKKMKLETQIFMAMGRAAYDKRAQLDAEKEKGKKKSPGTFDRLLTRAALAMALAFGPYMVALDGMKNDFRTTKDVGQQISRTFGEAQSELKKWLEGTKDK